MLRYLKMDKANADAADPDNKNGHYEHKSRKGHLFQINFFCFFRTLHFRKINRDLGTNAAGKSRRYSVESVFLIGFSSFSVFEYTVAIRIGATAVTAAVLMTIDLISLAGAGGVVFSFIAGAA